MCSYKLVRVKFEVWGLQTRVEAYVQRVIISKNNSNIHIFYFSFDLDFSLRFKVPDKSSSLTTFFRGNSMRTVLKQNRCNIFWSFKQLKGRIVA